MCIDPPRRSVPAGKPPVCLPRSSRVRDELVFGFAEQDADGGFVAFSAKGFVDRLDIEVEFAGELGLEVAGLEFDDNITVELGVVEEEVEIEVTFADLNGNLATQIGEPCSELDEELGDVVGELILKISLVVLFGEGQEVKDVGILKNLLGEVRLRG